MLLFHIPLDNYNAGGSIIKLLLAPATAVLALNIYQQRAHSEAELLAGGAGLLCG